jgi:putative oxidoreductase
MRDSEAAPRLLFPGLQRFYDFVVPLTWPLIRLAVGWNLIVHGWGKVTRGPSAYVAAFSQMGYEPALLFVWLALIIEFLGGICIAVGLFTRFWAAAAAVELGLITMSYWPTGFSWLQRGYEYTLLWGLILFAIALRGGGEYSLDRKLPKEL